MAHATSYSSETQIVLGRIKPDPYPFDEFA